MISKDSNPASLLLANSSSLFDVLDQMRIVFLVVDRLGTNDREFGACGILKIEIESEQYQKCF
jgi:hypothetical protein